MTAILLHDYFRGRGIPLREITPGSATPVRFSDAASEHCATRHSCGLFDFSFMACAEVSGRNTLALLHRTQTRNLTRLQEGRLAYTLLLRPDGTVLNDATVWRLGPEHYCIFAARRDDVAHIGAIAADFGVTIADRSSRHAIIAVQGPRAWACVAHCLSGVSAVLPYYAFAPARFGDADCLVARLGYSGEMGYEVVINAALGVALWQALLKGAGGGEIAECGFDAADSLRIEAGHILFSRELGCPVTPYELGLARLLDFNSEIAIGMAALRARRWQEPRYRLVGLLIDSLAPAVLSPIAGGDTLSVEAGTARLTSVCNSPTLGRVLGLGFVGSADRHPGTRVELTGGGSARVARLPFYDPGKTLVRSSR